MEEGTGRGERVEKRGATWSSDIAWAMMGGGALESSKMGEVGYQGQAAVDEVDGEQSIEVGAARQSC